LLLGLDDGITPQLLVGHQFQARGGTANQLVGGVTVALAEASEQRLEVGGAQIGNSHGRNSSGQKHDNGQGSAGQRKTGKIVTPVPKRRTTFALFDADDFRFI
jgi:hypothetical protein